MELSGGYAIITIPENLIDILTGYEEIIFIEKPKRLFYEVNEGRLASCIILFSKLHTAYLAREY